MKLQQAVWLLALWVFSGVQELFSQSIRYPISEWSTERRQHFRDAYAACNAFETEADLHKELYEMHDFGFINIHAADSFQNDPQYNDQFMPWHRIAAKYLEEWIRQCGITALPYWDETNPNYTTSNSSMWNQDFLGHDNMMQWLDRSRISDWTFTGDMETLIDDALSEANFEIFSRDSIERGGIHTYAHGWVGGDMSGSQSPRDPVFWLHHNFVDKIFDDWVSIHGSLPSDTYHVDLFGFTPMNTAHLGDVTIPTNSILDSKKDLGVFYAEDGVAEVGGGYVVGTGRKFTNDTPDCFYYPGRIEVNDLTVPAGSRAKFQTSQTIVLKPGFQSNGGQVWIQSGTGAPDCLNWFNGAPQAAQALPVKDNPDSQGKGPEEALVKLLSKPSSSTVEFEYALRDSRDVGKLLIVDVNGKIWKQLELERGGVMGKNRVSFSRQGWKAGVYYYTIRVGSRKQSGKLMLL